MAVRYRITHYIDSFADIEFPADFADDKGLPVRIQTNKNSSDLDALRT